jgi:hypothetical protein
MSVEDNLPKRIRIIKSPNMSLSIKIPPQFYPFTSTPSTHIEGIIKFIKDNYDIDSFYVGVQDGFVIFRENY